MRRAVQQAALQALQVWQLEQQVAGAEPAHARLLPGRLLPHIPLELGVHRQLQGPAAERGDGGERVWRAKKRPTALQRIVTPPHRADRVGCTSGCVLVNRNHCHSTSACLHAGHEDTGEHAGSIGAPSAGDAPLASQSAHLLFEVLAVGADPLGKVKPPLAAGLVDEIVGAEEAGRGRHRHGAAGCLDMRLRQARTVHRGGAMWTQGRLPRGGKGPMSLAVQAWDAALRSPAVQQQERTFLRLQALHPPSLQPTPPHAATHL